MAIDPLFPVTLPEYTDAADVKKAFYNYHYGTDEAITDEEQIQPNSMAGFIKETIAALEAAENKLGSIQQLTSSQNLNSITTNAIYLSTSSPSSTLSYPAPATGILTVVTDSDGLYSFQIYQTTTNRYFWRSASKNFTTNQYVWNTWLEASDTTHTHSQYAETTTLNNKVDTTVGTSAVASRAVATDANGKIVPVTTTSRTDIERIAGLTDTVNNLLAGKSNTDHTHPSTYYAQQSFIATAGVKHTARVFVQSSQPSATDADESKRPQAGDLWFW